MPKRLKQDEAEVTSQEPTTNTRLPKTNKICSKTSTLKKAEREWARPMPRYLVTRILQRDYLGEDSANFVSVWQLRHEDPLAHTYTGLTEDQHRKVRDLFWSIRTTALHKAVMLTEGRQSDLSFLGEGGKECGPYGTKGLTEMDYVFEQIAIRMSPDDTRVQRPAQQEALNDTRPLEPVDLINGKVAFLEFLE